MIFGSFLSALAQFPDPKFRRVLGLGIVLTFVLLIAIYALLLGFIEWSTGEATVLPFVGEVIWVGDLLSLGSLAFMIVASFFLMIPVASAITSLFLADVAQAVEDAHYPHLPAIPRQGFYDGLRETVNFLGVLLIANLVAIVLSLFLPIAAPVILYGTNGFLLGREYFQMVALRRLPRDQAVALRKANQGTVWMAGVLMALPLTIPLVNLVIPVLGAATFTHLFHKLNASSSKSA